MSLDRIAYMSFALLAACSGPESFVRTTLVLNGAESIEIDDLALVTLEDAYFSCESDHREADGYGISIGLDMTLVTAPGDYGPDLFGGVAWMLARPGDTPGSTTVSSVDSGTLSIVELDYPNVVSGTFADLVMDRPLEGISITAAEGSFRCVPAME